MDDGESCSKADRLERGNGSNLGVSSESDARFGEYVDRVDNISDAIIPRINFETSSALVRVVK